MKNFNSKIFVLLLSFGAVSCEDKLDLNTESRDVLNFKNGAARTQGQSDVQSSSSLAGFSPLYDGSDSGPIDLSVAKVWVQNFKDNMSNPEEVRSHYFGRDVIDQILRQDGCTGIRIYYALNDSGEKKIIISGVDSDGNNLLPASQTVTDGDNILADFSYPCPDLCPPRGDF